MPKNDYISRQELYDAVNSIGGCDASEEWAKGYDSAIDAAMDIIKEMPAADVEPVVRCGNCKRYELKGGSFWCVLHMVAMHSDDFCSYGKRKENDNGKA